MNTPTFTISITKETSHSTINLKITITDGNMQPLYDILKVLEGKSQKCENSSSLKQYILCSLCEGRLSSPCLVDEDKIPSLCVGRRSSRCEESQCNDILDASRNECLYHLREFNVDPSTSNDDKKRAFFVACANGKKESIKYLVTSKAVDINTQDGNGNTCLFFASINKREDCVNYLLRLGADPTIKNFFGISPLKKEEE